MYINIDAKDASYKDSTGKSSYCFCSEPRVRVTKKWRDQERGVEITGQFSVTLGTGQRGGTPKKINRNFEVWLGEDDLRAIILQALKNGLVCFPGEKQILEAKGLLEEVLEKTQLAIPSIVK
jgi:hypothetical protein